MKKVALKLISGVSMVMGLVVLGAVLFPIFSYNPEYSSFDKYLSPVPESEGQSFEQSPDLKQRLATGLKVALSPKILKFLR